MQPFTFEMVNTVTGIQFFRDYLPEGTLSADEHQFDGFIGYINVTSK